MKKLLVFVLFCLTACSDKDPVNPELQRIQTLIIGKWEIAARELKDTVKEIKRVFKNSKKL